MRRGQQYDNERGLARIRFKTNKKGKRKAVIVAFKPRNDKAKSAMFTINFDGVPECLSHPDFPDGEVFYADVNRTTQTLQNLFPSTNFQGTQITAHCTGFSHKEGEKPTFRTVEVQYKEKLDIQQKFYAVIEILSPIYLKGLTKGYLLRHDKFCENSDGTLGVKVDGPRGIYADKLYKFLVVTDGDKDDISYKDNNLPKVQKAIQKADKEFIIIVSTTTKIEKNGDERNYTNIDNLQSMNADDDWDADYDEPIEESNDDWDESEEEELAEDGEW